MSKPEERDPDEELLMKRFLDRTAKLSEAKAGAEIGISGTQVGKYRKGRWSTINTDTRRAMEDYLGMGVVGPDEQWRAGVRYACNRVADALRELEEVLDAVAPNKDRPAPPTKPPRAQ